MKKLQIIWSFFFYYQRENDNLLGFLHYKNSKNN